MLTNKTVLEALKKINDPEIHKSIVELNMVRNIKIDGTSIQLYLKTCKSTKLRNLCGI